MLAVLVLNRARPVRRDELIGALWPGEPPVDPDEALSALLSKSRQAVGRETLTGRRELTLALAADAEVDLEQALAASERAQGARAEGDWLAAWEAARAALEIAGRGFLLGVDAPWVEEASRRARGAAAGGARGRGRGRGRPRGCASHGCRAGGA